MKFDSRGNVMINGTVITSYSIHYTKLYDSDRMLACEFVSGKNWVFPVATTSIAISIGIPISPYFKSMIFL